MQVQVQKETKERKSCCYKCCLGTLVYIFVLLLLLFIVVFMVAPVVFKFSVGFQRGLIFPTWIAGTTNFSDFERLGIKGVRNFYVTVNEQDNVTLGVWQILPNEILSEFIRDDQYDYEAILGEDKYNILLYFHGNGGLRSIPLKLYEILRNYFHIISCDYRGYGDSSKADLTVDGVVNDTVSLYKWVRERTNARIFVWGHSLGTAVAVHSIARLKNEDSVVPSGLVLETPFTSVIDVMEMHPVIKVFSWLPWYRMSLLDPMVHNGLAFDSEKHITDVDCPMMILHAKDDTIIPYELATKLYETAVENRSVTQGNVTYHLWEALGYNHMDLWMAPELPGYVEDFITDCLRYEKVRYGNYTHTISNDTTETINKVISDNSTGDSVR